MHKKYISFLTAMTTIMISSGCQTVPDSPYEDAFTDTTKPSVVISEYNGIYNSDQTEVSGSLKIRVSDLENINPLESTLSLDNFILDVDGCNIKSTSIKGEAGENINRTIFNSNGNLEFFYNIDFSEKCNTKNIDFKFNSIYSKINTLNNQYIEKENLVNSLNFNLENSQFSNEFPTVIFKENKTDYSSLENISLDGSFTIGLDSDMNNDKNYYQTINLKNMILKSSECDILDYTLDTNNILYSDSTDTKINYSIIFSESCKKENNITLEYDQFNRVMSGNNELINIQSKKAHTVTVDYVDYLKDESIDFPKVISKQGFLTFNDTFTESSGQVVLGLENIIPESDNLVGKIEVKNFILTSSGCTMENYTLNQDSYEFKDTQDLRIDILANYRNICTSGTMVFQYDQFNNVYDKEDVLLDSNKTTYTISYNIGGSGSWGYQNPQAVSNDGILIYDENRTTLSGNIYIGINKEIHNTNGVTEVLKVHSFLPSVENCAISSYSISPNELTFTENGNKEVAVNINFIEPCKEEILTLSTSQTDTVALNGNNIYVNPSKNIFTYKLNGTSNIPIEDIDSGIYSINLEKEYDKFDINSINKMYYSITDKVTNNEASDAQITNISISSLTPSIIQILDGNSEVITYNKAGIEALNNQTLLLRTFDQSGSGLIKVTATLDINGDISTISEILTIPVLNNNADSMSIVYTGTRYEAPFYIDTYNLHVIDKNGNPAMDGEIPEIGVIGELKTNPDNDRLLLGMNTYNSFELTGDGSELTGTFGNSNYNFKNVEINDKLLIIPNETNKDITYTGGWDITSVNDDNISLLDDYNGSKTFLSYAIGNQTKYNECKNSNAIVDIDFVNNNYEIKDGTIALELRYDPYLVGKDVFVYANIKKENENRVGTAQKETLRGTGVQPLSFECTGDEVGPMTCDWAETVFLKDSNQVLRNSTFNGYHCTSDRCNSSDISFNNTVGCDGNVYVTITADSNETVSIELSSNIVEELSGY